MPDKQPPNLPSTVGKQHHSQHRLGVNHIDIYTDGACNKLGTGGWAFECYYGMHTANRYGWDGKTTSNRMELTAIVRALEFIPEGKIAIYIHTDSMYCRDLLNKWADGWKKNGWLKMNGGKIVNLDLIQRAYILLKKQRKTRLVKIKWVKGHNGLVQNERVDVMAVSARVSLTTNWEERTDLRTEVGNG